MCAHILRHDARRSVQDARDRPAELLASVSALAGPLQRPADIAPREPPPPAAPPQQKLPQLPARLLYPTADGLHLRNLDGDPGSDPPEPAVLLAMAVGRAQRDAVDALVRRFDMRTTRVLLFVYDDSTDAWSDLPWASSAVTVSARRQSKWWFAKRFLAPALLGNAYEFVLYWGAEAHRCARAPACAAGNGQASAAAARRR